MNFKNVNWDNREEVLSAVRINGLQLYLAPKYQSDKEIVTVAVNNDGRALEFVDVKLASKNPEIIEIARNNIKQRTAGVYEDSRDLGEAGRRTAKIYEKEVLEHFSEIEQKIKESEKEIEEIAVENKPKLKKSGIFSLKIIDRIKAAKNKEEKNK